MSDTIKLRPELFDALHLSALANGGIGCGPYFRPDSTPCCAYGHALWLDTKPDVCLDTRLTYELYSVGLYAVSRNDVRLSRAGVPDGETVPFERWCAIVGVDVAA